MKTDLQSLRDNLQKRLREASKLDGVRSAVVGRLQERFGVKTLAEARDKLDGLEAELKVATEELDESLDKLAEFEESDEDQA